MSTEFILVGGVWGTHIWVIPISHTRHDKLVGTAQSLFHPFHLLIAGGAVDFASLLMAFVNTCYASAPSHRQLFICGVQNLKLSILAFLSSRE